VDNDEELIEAYVTREAPWVRLLSVLAGLTMLGGCVTSYFALRSPGLVLVALLGFGAFALLMACMDRLPRRRALFARF
jgi:multisubunit Na+/H+ antiporter MnhB subunit